MLHYAVTTPNPKGGVLHRVCAQGANVAHAFNGPARISPTFDIMSLYMKAMRIVVGKSAPDGRGHQCSRGTQC